jgi:hypothetical protein
MADEEKSRWQRAKDWVYEKYRGFTYSQNLSEIGRQQNLEEDKRNLRDLGSAAIDIAANLTDKAEAAARNIKNDAIGLTTRTAIRMLPAATKIGENLHAIENAAAQIGGKGLDFSFSASGSDGVQVSLKPHERLSAAHVETHGGPVPTPPANPQENPPVKPTAKKGRNQ